ncbi:MAG: hypothetical protein PHF25_07800 [Candidatus Margulisbacteria bacterium]|nr:hypothetical protein [Candidatus Margulisiibacteriota bacterium]
MFAKKKITFLVIPHKAGSAKEYSIGTGTLLLIVVSLFLLTTMFVSTIYFSTKLSKFAMQYVQQERRNQLVLDELKSFRSETDNLRIVMLGLKERDSDIRKMLGMGVNRQFSSVGLKKN